MGVHGRHTRLLSDSWNLTEYFNNSDTPNTAEAHDDTTWGKDAKTYAPGLKDGTMALSGFWEGSEDSIDQILSESLGTPSGQIVTLAQTGFAPGGRVIMLHSRKTGYNISAPVGDLITVTADLQASGGMDRGVALHDIQSAEAASGNGLEADNTVSSTNGGVAHLHCIAASGTAPGLEVKIQHSVDGAAWVDLLSFSTLTAKGQQRLEVAGNINRRLRAIWTIGGAAPSFIFAVAFARR